MSVPLRHLHLPPQTDPPRPPKETLPTMYDLPSENPEEPGLPDEFHLLQPQLLRETFVPPSVAPEQVFVAADMNLYYQVTQPYWYKRPDWFAVLGLSRLYENQDMRLSYVVWQELSPPYIVVELLSPGTEKEDLGQQQVRELNAPPSKWEVYEQRLRVPYYFVFSRYTGELQAFCLERGRYVRQSLPDERLWLEDVGLGVWEGEYEQVRTRWIRWFDAAGQWLPCAREQVQAAQARALAAQVEVQAAQAEALAAQARAVAAEDRVLRMAAQLRALGIDVDAV